MSALFAITDDIQHVKSGGVYVIIGGPDVYRVECTGQPAYAYMGSDGIIWVRCQEEMEDGRFVLIPPKLTLG